VLRIKGRKPKSPLNGFQSDEVSKTHRFFSFMMGKALKKRLKHIRMRNSIMKMEIPSIRCRVLLSLTALILLTIFY
jgi:hypothetical protein